MADAKPAKVHLCPKCSAPYTLKELRAKAKQVYELLESDERGRESEAGPTKEECFLCPKCNTTIRVLLKKKSGK